MLFRSETLLGFTEKIAYPNCWGVRSLFAQKMLLSTSLVPDWLPCCLRYSPKVLKKKSSLMNVVGLVDTEVVPLSVMTTPTMLPMMPSL